MSISIRKILKESLKFSTTSLISKLLTLPVMIVLGRKLTPEGFGAVASITLILQYVTLITPGFTNAGAREIAHHNGMGDHSTGKKFESIANAGDFWFSCCISVFILVAACFQTTQISRIGFVVISTIFIADRLKTYYFNANYYRQSYNVNVVANMLASLVNPIVSITTVFFIDEYALLAAPLASSLAATLFYHLYSKHRLSFQWDCVELKKLFRTGIVLSLGGIAFWAFRLVDRTAITMFMSKSDLGLYFYAMSYVLLALQVLADFGKVLESMLWSETGNTADSDRLRSDITRMCLFIACIGGAAIPMLQIFYYLLVTFIVPRFASTAGLFNVMALSIYPLLMAMVPNILLSSKLVNKQHLIVMVYSLVTGLAFGIDVIAIRYGFGLQTIAWLSLICATILCMWLIWYIKEYISSSFNELAMFMGKLVIPFAASFVVLIAVAALSKMTDSVWILVLCLICIQTISLVPFKIFRFTALIPKFITTQ